MEAAYCAGRIQLNHPEVMTIFPADQNDDAAADLAVDDEDPVDCDVEDDDAAEPVIGAAPVTHCPSLGATPWLVFAGEKRQEIKRAKLSELWRGLSPEEQAAYAAPRAKVTGRGRGAIGRPKKK